MAVSRPASLTLLNPGDPPLDETTDSPPLPRGRDRREFARLNPLDLREPFAARLKYGDTVTIVDVSAGGALFETGDRLRPDSDLVLEVTGLDGEEPTHVVSRVLRCEVSGLRGGIRYRGACVFKRPLSHPALLVVPPLLHSAPADFLKLEFALKTIVEGYFQRSTGSGTAGRWKDRSALLAALERLQCAAERRDNPIERQLADLLRAVVPALKHNQAQANVVQQVKDHLNRQAPPPAIRVAGEYLLSLAAHWAPPVVEPDPPAQPDQATTPVLPESPAQTTEDLPAGWQRMVVRFVDGKLLRGYSNDFNSDRGHLHLCPSIGCAAADRLLVPVARLKAVFFVRDLQGTAEHADGNTFDHEPRARKLEVTFRDGEALVGSTLSYKPTAQGFFLKPANSRGNNLSVYVVIAAMRHMRFV